jgi:hypothetical protein
MLMVTPCLVMINASLYCTCRLIRLKKIRLPGSRLSEWCWQLGAAEKLTGTGTDRPPQQGAETGLAHLQAPPGLTGDQVADDPISAGAFDASATDVFPPAQYVECVNPAIVVVTVVWSVHTAEDVFDFPGREVAERPQIYRCTEVVISG